MLDHRRFGITAWHFIHIDVDVGVAVAVVVVTATDGDVVVGSVADEVDGDDDKPDGSVLRYRGGRGTNSARELTTAPSNPSKQTWM